MLVKVVRHKGADLFPWRAVENASGSHLAPGGQSIDHQSFIGTIGRPTSGLPVTQE